MLANALRKRPLALTMVETVVVAALISLIVIFTLVLVPSFKLSNRRASITMQAGGLAQASLERLRVGDFDKISAAAFDDVTVDGVTYKTTVQESEIVMAGTPAKPISKKVRVIVSWDYSSRHYEVFRETLLCRLLRS